MHLKHLYIKGTVHLKHVHSKIIKYTKKIAYNTTTIILYKNVNIVQIFNILNIIAVFKVQGMFTFILVLDKEIFKMISS